LQNRVDPVTGTILCETPEEALALSRRIEAEKNGDLSPQHQTPLAPSIPPVSVPVELRPRPERRRGKPREVPTNLGALTPERVKTLRTIIKGTKQETFINVLCASGEGLRDTDLWKILGFKKNIELAGITGALKKNVTKVGIGEEFIERRREVIGPRLGWRFSLTPKFKETMREAGWIFRRPVKLTG